jgi:hypothetical protein
MASEVMSIASCAASMALEEARAEVSKLRTEKYLMEQQLAKKAAKPSIPAASKMAPLIFRDQNYVSRDLHFVCVYTPCLYTRYT